MFLLQLTDFLPYHHYAADAHKRVFYHYWPMRWRTSDLYCMPLIYYSYHIGGDWSTAKWPINDRFNILVGYVILNFFKFQSTKREKGSISAGQVEANMEEISGDDTFGKFLKYYCCPVNCVFLLWKAGFFFLRVKHESSRIWLRLGYRLWNGGWNHLVMPAMPPPILLIFKVNISI